MINEWVDAAQVLHRELPPHVTDPTVCARWIRELANSSDGCLLGLCIAIDLLSGAVTPQRFGEVVSLVETSFTDPRSAFARAIAAHRNPDLFSCSSRIRSDPLLGPDRYVRILTLRDFVTYYAGPTYGFTLDAADIAEVKRIFGRAGASLEDIDQWWSGGNGVVWVGSWADATDVISADKAKAATLLNDRFGLGRSPSSGPGAADFVAVLYPHSFDRITKCRQPTTFDTSWAYAGTFFVSAPGHGWGLTQSCSGKRLGLRERVHGPFRSLTEAYSIEFIGESEHLSTDRAALLQEAGGRFRKVLGSPITSP
jgi:hypothetical protein